ncbi:MULTISPECIES: DUF948 domain-containing protein [unclassified Oceanobacillus]|uniref:DUF948 domain-containing protein n=1 Tax=unclassified Oceanobacillus TaxID=2630292 RepID=UPI00300E4F03
MGLIYLSILLVAIAFLITVVYICFVLKRVTNTIQTLRGTIGSAEERVEKMTPVLSQTIKETDELMADVTEKVQATDSMFDSVQLFGESVQSANTALQNGLGNLTDEEMDRKVKPFIEGIKWSEVAVQLYGTWKGKQLKQKNELMIQEEHDIVEVTGREG